AGFIRLDGHYAEAIPPPLANRLASRMIRGRLDALRACHAELSEPAQRRLLRRLVQLQGEDAQYFWTEPLGPEGPFAMLEGIVANAELFMFAAAAQHRLAGPLLHRVLSAASLEQRLGITEHHRRDLFNACEELLFRDGSSEYGLRCLALLAEAENEK